MISLHVDGVAVSSVNDIPKEMDCEQRRRYWDLFSSGASVVFVDDLLGLAIRDIKYAMRKPATPLLLAVDSVDVQGSVHTTFHFQGYAIKGAEIERRSSEGKRLIFADDHAISLYLIRLECYDARKKMMTVEAAVFDGRNTYELIARERCHRIE